MALDTSRYRNKLQDNNPNVNLVPLIDVIFTILIFLMVTSSFQAVADTSSSSGKPEINQTTGPSDYYLIPVAGLKLVTVNGVDMSKDIKNGAIAVHTRVIDEGEIIIKAKEGAIVIITPSDMSPDKAVNIPQR
ncbi:MAG: biopolymer transporter ExbD [Methanobacterium sp.]|nr:biopolymer transporter ExbD [Methanobacterium sp.]